MDTTDTGDTKAFTMRIPDETYRRIRVAAAEESKSAQQWMREALELVLERVEAKRDA